jgi:hypothetical protein
MIECPASASGRMAGIAGRTVVSVSSYTLVLIVNFSLVVMRVAIDAGKGCIIGSICVTIRAK